MFHRETNLPPSVAASRFTTKFCWICGKSVSLETCKSDEHGNVVHGNAVHEKCYAALLLKNSANENGAKFHVWKRQFREDCKLHEKINAYAALRDPVLRLRWESGVAPTVKAVA